MTRYYVEIEGREIGLEVRPSGTRFQVQPVDPPDQTEGWQADFAAVHCDPHAGEGLYSLLLDGKSYQLYAERLDAGWRMVIWRHRFDLKVLTEREWRLQQAAPKQAAHHGEVVISAPMPGLVKSVLVSGGEVVEAGVRLLVLEAMKMENDISAPRPGTVKKVHVEAGTVVEGGRPLITIE